MSANDVHIYKVNDLFLSVQAEGANAGKSAVFVRFSGCNLSCPFCDTNHEPFMEMTAEEIDREIGRLTNGDTRTLVVFTGGEPCMQLTREEEIGKGYTRAVETNGTLPIPGWVEWKTISPKSILPDSAYLSASEVKFLCGLLPEWYAVQTVATHPWLRGFIQPLERDGKMNIDEAVAFVNRHPEFTLSVQWHKLTGVK